MPVGGFGLVFGRTYFCLVRVWHLKRLSNRPPDGRVLTRTMRKNSLQFSKNHKRSNELFLKTYIKTTVEFVSNASRFDIVLRTRVLSIAFRLIMTTGI